MDINGGFAQEVFFHYPFFSVGNTKQCCLNKSNNFTIEAKIVCIRPGKLFITHLMACQNFSTRNCNRSTIGMNKFLKMTNRFRLNTAMKNNPKTEDGLKSILKSFRSNVWTIIPTKRNKILKKLHSNEFTNNRLSVRP